MPTEKQIKAEIAALTEARGYVPERTMFGEDNIEAIDASIEVLTERLTEDEVMERSGNEDEEDDSKWSQHTGDIARDAAQWLAGEETERPSEGWKIFKKKKKKVS